jgi:hypothetical protein
MRNSVFQSPVLMEGYLKKHSSGKIFVLSVTFQR